tara:strand:- start:1138 stop:1785 length:648 start_codon:yes stop_codon:yes gene_type:complete
MEIIIKIILSYLLGAFSGSMLIGKIKKVDIRKMGSGNAGGTNAFRTMGLTFAIGVIAIDILKGYIAVEFIPYLNLESIFIKTYIINLKYLPVACSIGVVLGHVYPIYYKFKGGKGAGTMIGVLASLFPNALYICLLVWVVILILTGYVGLSTIIAGCILPICTIFFYPNGLDSPFGFFSIIIATFIIYTHRGNIHRILIKKENRFEKIMLFRKRK